MKRNTVFSMLAVVSILFAITLTGCGNMTDKAASDQADSTEVKPTGKADPELRGTSWKGANSISSRTRNIVFAKDDTNKVSINELDATYSVSGSTVSFDLTQYVQIQKSLTLDTYLKKRIAETEKAIADLERRIKEEQDEARRASLQKDLLKGKDHLEKIKNPSAEYKTMFATELAHLKEVVATLEPFAQFTGTLNDAKTELSIEKFPVEKYNVRDRTSTWETEKITFKKK